MTLGAALGLLAKSNALAEDGDSNARPLLSVDWSLHLNEQALPIAFWHCSYILWKSFLNVIDYALRVPEQ